MASTTAVVPETPGRGTAGRRGRTTLRRRPRPPSSPRPREPAAYRAGRPGGRPRREAPAARAAAATAAADLPAGQQLPAGCTPDELPALLQRYYWSEPAAEVLGHDPAELAGAGPGPPARSPRSAPRGRRPSTSPRPRRPGGHPDRHRRHAVPRRLGHRRGRPPGRRAGSTSSTRWWWCAATSPAGSAPSATAAGDAGSCGPDAVASRGWPSSSTGRWTRRPPPTWSPGCAPCWPTSAPSTRTPPRMRARALELADAARAAARRPGRAAPERPGRRPRRGRRAAALAGRRQLRVPRRPRRRRRPLPRGKAALRPVPGSGPRRAAQRRRHERRRADDGGRAAGAGSRACSPSPRPTPAPRCTAAPGWTWSRSPCPATTASRRQHRLVGLFPTTAAAASVRDVPLLRRRVADVIARSGVPADSHTGKALLDVLETYPRDELFQVGTDELLPVAHGRAVPAGAPPDPAVPAPRSGRPVLVGAGLPAARPVHDRGPHPHAAAAARAAGRHEHRVHRPVHRVGAGPAALRRPHAGRPPRGTPRPPDVDVEALQAELAGAARSWTDELSDALHGPVRPADAERMLARVADAFPAAYQEDFPADRAVRGPRAAGAGRPTVRSGCASGRRPTPRRASAG